MFKYDLASNIVIFCLVRVYGITKDPKTNNFMVVMRLLKGGLRLHLDKSFASLN